MKIYRIILLFLFIVASNSCIKDQSNLKEKSKVENDFSSDQEISKTRIWFERIARVADSFAVVFNKYQPETRKIYWERARKFKNPEKTILSNSDNLKC